MQYLHALAGFEDGAPDVLDIIQVVEMVCPLCQQRIRLLREPHDKCLEAEQRYCHRRLSEFQGYLTDLLREMDAEFGDNPAASRFRKRLQRLRDTLLRTMDGEDS